VPDYLGVWVGHVGSTGTYLSTPMPFLLVLHWAEGGRWWVAFKLGYWCRCGLWFLGLRLAVFVFDFFYVVYTTVYTVAKQCYLQIPLCQPTVPPPHHLGLWPSHHLALPPSCCLALHLAVSLSYHLAIWLPHASNPTASCLTIPPPCGLAILPSCHLAIWPSH